MELKDKVALVTGGAQGIGKIVGEELARQGAHVILGDVNLEGAENRQMRSKIVVVPPPLWN